MLRVDSVTAGYGSRSRLGRTTVQTVLHGVDLEVRAGEIVALVGESGSGKSTLARVIVALLQPFDGHVLFDGADVHEMRGAALLGYRRNVQMIFQDPMLSLSPRVPVGKAVAEALDIHAIGSRKSRQVRTRQLLDAVELPASVADRLPKELSGGQRQRIAIARALAVEPRLLICDEPVTALDAPVQATVLNLLLDLGEEFGLGCLFIAHDLAVACQLADRVVVMRDGRVVEQAPTATITTNPSHSYTRTLLAAVPRLVAATPIGNTHAPSHDHRQFSQTYRGNCR
jgi:oligopeptide transport system ATP-binding protein